MTGWMRESAEVGQVTWRAGRLGTFVALLVSPFAYVAIAASAVTQRALVDLRPGAAPAEILLLACAAGLVWSIWSSANWVRGGLQDQLNVKAARELRRLALDRIVRRRAFEDLDDPEYADAVELLRRGAYRLGSINWALFGGATSIIGLAASVILLLSVDPRLLLVALGAVASVLAATFISARNVSDEHQLAIVHRQERALHEACILPRGVQEIRGYSTETAIDARADELWRYSARRRLHTRLRAAVLTNVAWSILGAGLVYGLIVIGGEIDAGRATVGDLVLLVTLTMSLDQQVWNTKEHLAAIGEAVSIARAARTVRDRAGDARGRGAPIGALRHGIRLDGLRFEYASTGRTVLHEVDLDIPAGSVLAIVGHNGAGKSTLANLLLGVLHPSDGSIRIDGAAPDRTDWLRSSTGAFQDFMKPKLTLHEAVGLGELDRLDEPGATERALRASGGDRLLQTLPEGMTTSLAGDTGLSHGQWQTVGLARSAMREEALLLVLDEPSSALDAHAEHEVFARFIERGRRDGATRGTISIVISHRYSSAYLADLILVVEGGRIIEQGTHTDLMHADGEYRRMFELQAAAYRS